MLRIEAYRHILWHRLPSKRIFQSLLASSLLHAYLDYKAYRQDDNERERDVEHSDASNVFFDPVGTVGARCGDAVGRNGWRRCCNGADYEPKACHYGTFDLRRLLLLLWALCLPAALHVVTILVLIWENLSTVKQLASVYVFHAVHGSACHSRNDNKKKLDDVDYAVDTHDRVASESNRAMCHFQIAATDTSLYGTGI